jgi:toxin ParE1/3/4
MKYNIVFQPRVVSEIQISIDYYDKQQVGLGKEFYIELFEYIDAIIVNPFYKIYSGNIRVLPLKKFQFVIFYWIDELEKRAYIEAVFHTSQNIDKYPKK